MSSLIIANLTMEEFDKFHGARLPYSGSAGDPHYTTEPSKWGPHAPYLASFLDALPDIIKALEWDYFTAIPTGGTQWVIRKRKDNEPKIDPYALFGQMVMLNV